MIFFFFLLHTYTLARSHPHTRILAVQIKKKPIYLRRFCWMKKEAMNATKRINSYVDSSSHERLVNSSIWTTCTLHLGFFFFISV